MARANLNKSENLVTNTNAVSKHIPKKPRYASLEIPPFRPHFIKFLKTVSYEVNLTSQHFHLKILLLSKFCSEREDFN